MMLNEKKYICVFYDVSDRGEMSVCLQRESSEFSGLFCQAVGYNRKTI